LSAKELALKQEVEIRLHSLPFEERASLTKFFRRLFYHGDFAYTLLGRKPMGSIDYNLNLLAFPKFYKEPEKHLLLMALDKKGWRIWEQYKDLFPMKRYSFIKVEYDTFFGILLINKEKAHAVIKENLSLFQRLVGKKLHAKKILKLLCNGQFGYYHSNNTYCLLDYYEALGLLYGYGKENVRAFIKRAQLSQNLRSLPIEIKILPSKVVNYIEMEDSPITCSKCRPQNDFEIMPLVCELNVLLENVQLIKGTNKNNPFLPLQKSLFLGNEQLDQTRAVIENYDDLNETILKIYESDKFLETILGMLTQSVQ
jgi:hypothetical protein